MHLILLLETAVEEIDREGPTDINRPAGLFCLQEKSTEHRVRLVPIVEVEILRVNRTLAAQWDTTLYYARRQNLCSWSITDSKFRQDLLFTVTSQLLQRLPGNLAGQLLHAASIATEEDSSIRDLAIQAYPLNEVINGYAENMLLYLAGRFGEVKHSWPDDHTWLVG